MYYYSFEEIHSASANYYETNFKSSSNKKFSIAVDSFIALPVSHHFQH